jgi:O-acetyl-ADP-ribose deacetylase (regulator of RNase III)
MAAGAAGLFSLITGSTRIEIVDGDIADQDVDAIVNAANNHFWMGSGVAGALKARGGGHIEQEAMALGPVPPGECVVTSGGRLPARCVIHAAVMGQDLVTSAAVIERATQSALRLADSHGMTSMAFPAFGTGVGGFPLTDCARIMLKAVRDRQVQSVRLVRFVLFGDRAFRVFAEVASQVFEAVGPADNPPAQRDSRDPQDRRDPPDPRDLRDPQDPRDPRDLRDPL